MTLNKDDYPANSMTSRNPVKEKRETKKLTTGRRIQTEKPVLMRVFGDNASNVFRFVFFDVLGPALKSTFVEMVQTGIEMFVFGENTPSKKLRRDRGRTIVNYNSIYDKPRIGVGQVQIDRSRRTHNFDDILITTRGEAELVLEHMLELIEEYDVCTVEDFYAACDIETTHTDTKYGWDNLSQAEIRLVRGGNYIIKLPRPKLLD